MSSSVCHQVVQIMRSDSRRGARTKGAATPRQHMTVCHLWSSSYLLIDATMIVAIAFSSSYSPSICTLWLGSQWNQACGHVVFHAWPWMLWKSDFPQELLSCDRILQQIGINVILRGRNFQNRCACLCLRPVLFKKRTASETRMDLKGTSYLSSGWCFEPKIIAAV